MSSEWLILLGPVALFMMSMTLTPGPNNLMLTASGANFGVRRTVPHMGGIVGGCFMLYLAIALGLGVLFERFPVLHMTLRWVGSAYLLYLAFKIATAPPPNLKDAAARGTPLTFWQAALFQLANPKAWVLGLALIAGFLPESGPKLINAVILVGFAELVALPCLLVWAGFGMAIGRWIKSDRAWRAFNVIMGLLTAACVILILR
ncbi:threonine/homoserine/homoserine lactone efflux protein [Vreelandella songnenensis]|uniref:Threonine/homoserine/homoserine lactone efflux protein n=1 Tax=Vreelandella songnenensis TaxID=1176243 RepID=A0A2T0V9L5_9GAMM|nr:LysE family translocator [Halomonas songnenensis]PRY66876.1 threonine/homoserine/homoserine lactone efflux protein [Halomonas songnenensis]